MEVIIHSHHGIPIDALLLCNFTILKWDFFLIYFFLVIFSIQYAGVKSCFLQVLNQLCDVIVEPLRDRVVTGLLQASLVFNMLTKHSRVGLVMIYFFSSVGWFVASNTWWRAFTCILLKWCQVNWRWSSNPKGTISHHYAEIAFQNLYTWSYNRKLCFHTTHCHSLLKVTQYFFIQERIINVFNLFTFFLGKIQEFFISGGDGLPRGTVENLVARIRPVITLLGYEVLISCFVMSI